MSSDIPPLPPDDFPPGWHIEHAHFNYGPNAHSTSTTTTTTSQTASVVSKTTFYEKHLAKHSWSYWLVHLAVALLAAALFEGFVLLFNVAPVQ
jgi:hypothetical protein